jgi:hypothetical protein
MKVCSFLLLNRIQLHHLFIRGIYLLVFVLTLLILFDHNLGLVP